MKKLFIFAALTAFLWNIIWFLNPNLSHADAAKGEDKNIAALFLEGQGIAKEISKAVGVSISPLLGMSALGAYNYWKTPEYERSNLAWHSSPMFWLPLLVILFAFIAKDSVKTVLPIPKLILAPLDALEVVENKMSGLTGLIFVLSSINGIKHSAVTTIFQQVSIPAAYAGTGVAFPDHLSVQIVLTTLFTQKRHLMCRNVMITI